MSNITNQVKRLDNIDRMIFSNHERNNFMLITDEENVAAYVKGKSGDSVSLINVTTDLPNYDLWIVKTSQCDDLKFKRKWITNEHRWNKLMNGVSDESVEKR